MLNINFKGKTKNKSLIEVMFGMLKIDLKKADFLK